jgi:hypothetical protein
MIDYHVYYVYHEVNIQNRLFTCIINKNNLINSFYGTNNSFFDFIFK